MKRIICVFISLVMLLSGFSVFAQNGETTTVSENALEALEILQALNFANKDYSLETMDFNKTVTRAEFAALAGRIFNVHKQQGNTLYFYDVSRDHFAFDGVTYLADIGAINGNGGKLFNPDDEISLIDASKIILYALGYDFYIEASGGYPGGVNVTSTRIGLYDSISNKGGALTYSDMFVLLQNAIMAEVLETTGISGDGVQLDARGNTFLNIMYNVYFEKGIFTGFNSVCYGDTSCYENQAVISNTVFETKGDDYTDFLGCEVKYLYEYNKAEGKYRLIWVKATEKSEALELDYEENSTAFSASDYTLSYYDENDKVKTASISKDVSVIYNGRVLESGIIEVFDGGFDSIRLIRTGTGKEYNVAVVDSYDSFVVGSVDKLQQKIYDKYTQKPLELEKAEEVYFYNASGLMTDLSAVTKDSVVSIFSSMDGDVIKVYISTDVFEGDIENICKENGGWVYTIDEKEYKFDKGFDPSSFGNGDRVKAYVDVNGKIVYMEILTGDQRFGYLINIAVDKDSTLLEDGLYFRLLTDTSELLSKVKCSKSAKIDGISVKENYPAKAYNLLGGAAYAPEMVMFRLNSKGEVIFLDTLNPNEGSYFRKIRTNQYYIRSATELFTNSANAALDNNGSVLVASTAKIFNVSADKTADDRSFRADKYSAYTHHHFDSMSAYTASESEYYAEALLAYDLLDIDVATGSATRIMVTDVIQSLNDDGDAVNYIVGVSYGGEVQMECAAEYIPSDVNYGDVIAIDVNRHMEVTGVSKLYDVKTNIANIPFTYYNINASSQFSTYGRVYDVVDGAYVYLSSEADPDRALDFYRGIGTVYIYDSENDEITEGTINDLKTTKSSGLGDKLFIWYGHSTQVRLAVVWR